MVRTNYLQANPQSRNKNSQLPLLDLITLSHVTHIEKKGYSEHSLDNKKSTKYIIELKNNRDQKYQRDAAIAFQKSNICLQNKQQPKIKNQNSSQENNKHLIKPACITQFLHSISSKLNRL